MTATCTNCGGEADRLIEMDVTDPDAWDEVDGPTTGCTTEEGLYVHDDTEAQVEPPDPDSPTVRSGSTSITGDRR